MVRMTGRAPLAERVLTRAALGELPTPKPLIADTIDQRTVSVLAGPWGTCKSFLAQDWAACVATGRRWQNRAVMPGRVVYVAAEGAYGLHQRFESWEVGWNSGTPIADNRLKIVPCPVNLTRPDEIAELAEVVKGADLIVIDTLARCLVGADENSARDIGVAVDALYQLRDATGNGGSVLAVHHTGKDRTTIRGSSALEAGVDCVYQVEGDTRNLKVYRTKRKDGPREDTIQLRLNDVQGTSSAVLSRLLDGMRMTDSEEKIISHLRSHYGDVGATRKELVDTSQLSQPTVYRAVTALVNEGVLHSETKGNTVKFYLADGQ